MIRKMIKWFSVLLTILFVTVSASMVPVKAENPTITFNQTVFFVKSGESVGGSYTTTGSPEVWFDSAQTIDSEMNREDLIDFRRNKTFFIISASEGDTGFGIVSVYLNGVYETDLTIYVYDDTDLKLEKTKDAAGLLSEGYMYVEAKTDPYAARYAPLTVESSDPSVVSPDTKVMPASALKFDLLKLGSSKITVSYGSQREEFQISALKDGDYAEEVVTKDGEYDFYVKKGKTIPSPFIMVSETGTCKDDKLSYEVEFDSMGSGDHGFISVDPDGTIHGLQIGEADLCASTILGLEYNVTVYVYDDPKKISFDEEVYYINQNDEWIEYPYWETEPEEAGHVPVVFTSSNEKAVSIFGSMNTLDMYRFEGEGESVIRCAYKDDPSIYGEFKAKAFYAEEPKSISLPVKITLYPEYSMDVDVEYKPYLSLHKVTDSSVMDDSVADIAENYGDTLVIVGKSEGNTVLEVKAGSKASATMNISVLAGKPSSKDEIKIGKVKNDMINVDTEDVKDTYTFTVGSQYQIDGEREYEFDLRYMGDEDQIGINAAENLKKTGLFEVDLSISAPTERVIVVKAVKTGTAEVEIMPGKKIKMTVQTASIKMHRLYNPNSGEHFYTAKEKEKDALVSYGWKYEGIGWNAPQTSKTPVYRLYNSNSGDHHYTMKAKEKDALVNLGWKYEGIGWHSDDAKGVPLYREYNPNMEKCNHNYTTKKAEHDYLTSHGWNDEGIGWYGVKQ